ncbi:MAG TPA: hypothetical protein VFF67_08830 [Thermoplasmata archaeon]|nr:hypothetical protein [Thermoplasmata archaeon]
MESRRHRFWRVAVTLTVALVAIGAILAVSLPGYRAAASPTDRTAPESIRAAPTFSISSFTFSPNPISVNSQASVSIQLSGGNAPFYAWMNGTPPGCVQPSIPYVTSSSNPTFTCNPSSTGSYNIHLDVLDSSTPAASHAQASTRLTVNSNGGNNGNGSGGNNNGNGSKGGFSLPTGLIGLATIFLVVFLAAFVALAAGVIATAVAVSRGLKRLNRTMAENRGTLDVGRSPPTPPAPPK